MTFIEVAAWIGSAILVKGTVIGAVVMLAARCARSAAGASLALGLGLGALGLVALLGPLLPEQGSGIVAIRHEAVQSVSIGPLAVSPVGLFVGIWVIGAALLLLRFIRDLRAALALIHRAGGQTGRRADGLLIRAGAAVGITRVPGMRETSELATVALIGFRHPVLLIPVAAREWSDEELFGILCHELEHMRRGDWLMLMLERVINAVFWINPVVHLLSRQASAMRERAADDAAMRAGAGATAYAGRLISVARELKRAPRLAVSVAFADGGSVTDRVHALFESQRDRRRVASGTALRSALAALPLIAVLAAVEPWTCLPGGTTNSEACP